VSGEAVADRVRVAAERFEGGGLDTGGEPVTMGVQPGGPRVGVFLESKPWSHLILKTPTPSAPDQHAASGGALTHA